MSVLAETKEKRYVSDNAQLMAEWNWEKNTQLGISPDQVTCGSDKKAWWICSQNHEWQSSIGSKNRGCGCPYCSGLYVIKGENDLKTLKPNLVQEWDYKKNGSLIPEELSVSSHKKVWWLCSNGHSWEAAVSKRTQGRGCPICQGKKVLQGYNDLATTHPKLTVEWDYDKNIGNTPQDISAFSNKKFWWKCEEGHSWQSAVSKRTIGRKCPYCKGKNVLIGYNDLTTTHPNLILEWDYDKNISISPHEVSKGSSEKVWWLCKYNHSWKAQISSRTSGCGCPQCASELQTSFPEKVIYYYVKKSFPDAVCNFKSKLLEPYELDIFIPSLKLGIEYDGERWHQNLEKDLKKNKKCNDSNITLIRIREPKCPILSDNLSKNIVLPRKKDIIGKAVEDLFMMLSHITQKQYVSDINLSRDNVEILSLLEVSEKENNLGSLYPSIAKKWDFNKNGTLSPNDFTPMSSKKVWWPCPSGHSYFAPIASLVSGRGCPVCSGKLVFPGFNDLASKCPEILSTWDYNKNTINPSAIAFGSDKKIWWICSHGHSYLRSVNNQRANKNCPVCSGRTVLSGFNDLTTTHPAIAVEWSYELNDLKPADVSAGSHKKVWWKCDSCGHKWNSAVYTRTSGHGCPKCNKKKVVSKKA